MAWYDFDEDLVYILRSAEVRGARNTALDSVVDVTSGLPLNLRQGGISVPQVISDDFADAVFQADVPTALLTVGTRTWLAKSAQYEDQARTDAAAAEAAAAVSAAAASSSATAAASSLSTAATALATAIAALNRSAGGLAPGTALLPGDVQVGVTDPRLIYAGSVAGSSIEMAFPFMAWDGPRQIAVVIFKDGQDGVSTTGNIKLGTSKDYGRTWSLSSTVVAGPGPHPVGPGGVTVLPDGRWYVTYDRFETTGPPATYTMWTTYSSDQGATWSTPVQIANPGYTGYVVTAAPVTVLASGDFVLPIYGANTAGNSFVKVMASADAGVSWTVRATLAGVGGIDIMEPMLWEVSPGNLVMITRGSDHQARRWTSADSGATWSAPAVAWAVTDSIVKACKMTSGRWLLLDRDNLQRGTNVRYSDDNLATFSAAQPVVNPDMRTTYHDLVETVPGRALMVYGAELQSATGGGVNPQGDIWTRYLTDGHGPAPDGQVTSFHSRERAGGSLGSVSMLAWDTFKRPDNPTGVGAADSGHRWWPNVVVAGTGVPFGAFLSGQTVHVGAAGQTDLTVETGVADVDIEGDFTWVTGTATGFGLTARMAADNSHLNALITTSATHMILYSVSAAQAFTVITDVALALPAVIGKYTKVRLKCYGNNIKVYVDDDLVISATSAINNTATKHGIHLGNASSADHHCRRFVARSIT